MEVSWRGPAHSSSKLFHSLDPFDDWLTELFHTLFLRGHRSGLPTVRGLKPPVCDSTLTFILWLPDNFDGHAKLRVPGFNAPDLVGNRSLATINNDVGQNEGESLQ